ncbi:MAG: hypothetical protein WDW36_002898 [Sanguina aurantia]
MGSIHLKHRRCALEGCRERPAFNQVTATIGQFCGEHEHASLTASPIKVKSSTKSAVKDSVSSSVAKPSAPISAPISPSSDDTTNLTVNANTDASSSAAAAGTGSATSSGSSSSSSSTATTTENAISSSSDTAEATVKPRLAAERAAFQRELKSFAGEAGVIAAQREVAAAAEWEAADLASKQYHLPPTITARIKALSPLLDLKPAHLTALTEAVSHVCRHIPAKQHRLWDTPQKHMEQLVSMLLSTELSTDQIIGSITQYPALLLSWTEGNSGPEARSTELRAALGLSESAFQKLLYEAPQVLADTVAEVNARLAYIANFYISAGAAATSEAALSEHVLPLLSEVPLVAAVSARGLRALAVTTNSAGVPFRALAAAVAGDGRLLLRSAQQLTAQLHHLVGAGISASDIALCPALLSREYETVLGPRLAYAAEQGLTVVSPSELQQLQGAADSSPAGLEMASALTDR